MAKKDEMPSHHGVKYESGGDFPNPTMQLLIERAAAVLDHQNRKRGDQKRTGPPVRRPGVHINRTRRSIVLH
jgi:hypothetical protein